ncbi:MAG: hypothetical protein CMH64_02005 [Nanoarchaeota archaeon]|nr:hypothetical protein [Nanoarchaeota archaeon]|tara:strand:- start:437 stop:733 length:297 start_codon:yes stop_codon:yes gene_type:complete
MSYKIKVLEKFKEQVRELDKKSKKIIENKILLIKENPFRFKRLNTKHLSRVFRVRLNVQSKETRLIYAVLEPNIILVCLLERKKDYKDLEKYISKLKT